LYSNPDGPTELWYTSITLGREGVFELTAVVPMDESNVVKLAAMVQKVATSIAFDKGHRYEDYVMGNKEAGYGIEILLGEESPQVKHERLRLVALVGLPFIAVSILGLMALLYLASKRGTATQNNRGSGNA
jgi:uncharacterized membrane-anchored protein